MPVQPQEQTSNWGTGPDNVGSPGNRPDNVGSPGNRPGNVGSLGTRTENVGPPRSQRRNPQPCPGPPRRALTTLSSTQSPRRALTTLSAIQSPLRSLTTLSGLHSLTKMKHRGSHPPAETPSENLLTFMSKLYEHEKQNSEETAAFQTQPRLESCTEPSGQTGRAAGHFADCSTSHASNALQSSFSANKSNPQSNRASPSSNKYVVSRRSSTATEIKQATPRTTRITRGGLSSRRGTNPRPGTLSRAATSIAGKYSYSWGSSTCVGQQTNRAFPTSQMSQPAMAKADLGSKNSGDDQRMTGTQDVPPEATSPANNNQAILPVSNLHHVSSDIPGDGFLRQKCRAVADRKQHLETLQNVLATVQQSARPAPSPPESCEANPAMRLQWNEPWMGSLVSPAEQGLSPGSPAAGVFRHFGIKLKRDNNKDNDGSVYTMSLHEDTPDEGKSLHGHKLIKAKGLQAKSFRGRLSEPKTENVSKQQQSCEQNVSRWARPASKSLNRRVPTAKEAEENKETKRSERSRCHSKSLIIPRFISPTATITGQKNRAGLSNGKGQMVKIDKPHQLHDASSRIGWVQNQIPQKSVKCTDSPQSATSKTHEVSLTTPSPVIGHRPRSRLSLQAGEKAKRNNTPTTTDAAADNERLKRKRTSPSPSRIKKQSPVKAAAAGLNKPMQFRKTVIKRCQQSPKASSQKALPRMGSNSSFSPKPKKVAQNSKTVGSNTQTLPQNKADINTCSFKISPKHANGGETNAEERASRVMHDKKQSPTMKGVRLSSPSVDRNKDRSKRASPDNPKIPSAGNVESPKGRDRQISPAAPEKGNSSSSDSTETSDRDEASTFPETRCRGREVKMRPKGRHSSIEHVPQYPTVSSPVTCKDTKPRCVEKTSSQPRRATSNGYNSRCLAISTYGVGDVDTSESDKETPAKITGCDTGAEASAPSDRGTSSESEEDDHQHRYHESWFTDETTGQLLARETKNRIQRSTHQGSDADSGKLEARQHEQELLKTTRHHKQEAWKTKPREQEVREANHHEQEVRETKRPEQEARRTGEPDGPKPVSSRGCLEQVATDVYQQEVKANRPRNKDKSKRSQIKQSCLGQSCRSAKRGHVATASSPKVRERSPKSRVTHKLQSPSSDGRPECTRWCRPAIESLKEEAMAQADIEEALTLLEQSYCRLAQRVINLQKTVTQLRQELDLVPAPPSGAGNCQEADWSDQSSFFEYLMLLGFMGLQVCAQWWFIKY